MKIAICDDISSERTKIKNYCEALGFKNISLFSSGEELLAESDLTSFELIFLDIEMGEQSGIDVKNSLEHMSPSTSIVFTTTHEELMPDAFGRNVISFLTKPFTERSIKQCIKKAASFSKEFFPIEIDENIMLPCREILYLQSEHKHTIFHTAGDKTYSSRVPLKAWIERLNKYDFSPISRQAAINLKYYGTIKEKQVLLSDGTRLPVSRRHIPVLEKNFKTYMLSRIR